MMMRTISNDQGIVNVIIEHNELMELLNNIARAACIGKEMALEGYEPKALRRFYKEQFNKVTGQLGSVGLGVPHILEYYRIQMMKWETI